MYLAKCRVEKHCFMLECWVGSGIEPGFELRLALTGFQEGPSFARVEACGHVVAVTRLSSIRNIMPRAV